MKLHHLILTAIITAGTFSFAAEPPPKPKTHRPLAAKEAQAEAKVPR